MSKNQGNFSTPPMMSLSVSPAVCRAPKTPQKNRPLSRLSTPNVAVRLTSPMMSPILPNNQRMPQMVDSGRKNTKAKLNIFEPAGKMNSTAIGADISSSDLSLSKYVSPLEKSYRAPLDDPLDLQAILKEFEMSHLGPALEANGIGLSELSELKQQDFVDLGIFKLNELDKLKRICNLLNDKNTSY